MTVRPLARYRLKPIHKPVVRKTVDMDMLSALVEGEPLSIRAMKRPLKVLKKDPASARSNEPAADDE